MRSNSARCGAIAVVLSSLVVVGCGHDTMPGSTTTSLVGVTSIADDSIGGDGSAGGSGSTTSDPIGGMQLANPASTFCIEQGGELEVHDQMNWCLLPDGRWVEEWELFRSQHPSSTTAP